MRAIDNIVRLIGIWSLVAVSAATLPTTTRAAAPGSVTFTPTSTPFTSTLRIFLSGASANQTIRYTLTPATEVSPPDPTRNSAAYTGPLDLSTPTLVRAAVFSNTDGTAGRITTSYFPKLDATVASFTSQLPVIVIDTFGSGPLTKDGVDHRSWLFYFPPAVGNSTTFDRAPTLASPSTTTVRGATSAEFPKKSFNSKFTDADGDTTAPGGEEIGAFARWSLVGPWNFDQSYINNALVYSLSNQLGRWAAGTQFVELYFNSDGGSVTPSNYAGIYVLTDRIEVAKGRVSLTEMKASDVSGPRVTGGYLLKIDVPDPDEIGWHTERGLPDTDPYSVVLVYPKESDIVPAQLAYIRDYVQRMETALYSDRDRGWAQRTYLDYLDRASWVDLHLINTFVCNPDALLKSTYFTKDRNGKLTAGPVWDFDRALGSYWDERSFRWDIWSGVGGVDFWRTSWWGVLAQDPEFMQEWVDRWQALRRGEFSNPNLIAEVEAQGDKIGSAAAARDAARWPDNASPYGSYADQIQHLKGWITLRAQWIDAQFLSAPEVVATGDALTFTAPTGAQIAYTLDGSDPRALGGGIAATTLLSASPLVVPTTANVQVRSYRADLRDTFPGSPWSSVVGGAKSSPVFPRARLVNLSSRAIAGAGEDALFSGVVVADTVGKPYLARAIGPGLATFGASGVLPDPRLIVQNGGTELFRNLGWETDREATNLPTYSKSVGAFPLVVGVADSALAADLPSGAYTLQVASPAGRSGLVLAELYELGSEGRTVNLSTRARVRAGDGVLIGGFVIQGPARKRVLLRGVGPTLAAFGVAAALTDPVLTLYSGQTVIATNDQWERSDNAAAVVTATTAAGAFKLAPGSEDAALLVTLSPGPYTVEVRGKNNTEGVALIEIYDLP